MEITIISFHIQSFSALEEKIARMIPLTSDSEKPTPLENPSKPAEKPTQQNHHHEQDGDHGSQAPKHDEHEHDAHHDEDHDHGFDANVSSVRMIKALSCHTVITIITFSRKI